LPKLARLFAPNFSVTIGENNMKNVYKMTKKKDEATYKTINGDNVLGLKKSPTRSIALITTYSPFAINFAEKEWDNDVVSQEALEEAFKVLKHGAFMLCFASSSTAVPMIQSKSSFIGIELCPNYCQVGLARINKHLSDIDHPTECEFEALLTTEEAA
tara:strand:+ start:34614 stop:35087 length:474 start_codon:yes stop_codon:yes gene_type:complete